MPDALSASTQDALLPCLFSTFCQQDSCTFDSTVSYPWHKHYKSGFSHFLSVCPVLRASPVKTESLALPPTLEQAVWKLLCQGHYKHRGRHCPPGRPLPRRSALKKSAARLSTCVPLQLHSGLAHNATLFP